MHRLHRKVSIPPPITSTQPYGNRGTQDQCRRCVEGERTASPARVNTRVLFPGLLSSAEQTYPRPAQTPHATSPWTAVNSGLNSHSTSTTSKGVKTYAEVASNSATLQKSPALNSKTTAGDADRTDSESPRADAAQVFEFLAWGRQKDRQFDEAKENDAGSRRTTTTYNGIEDASSMSTTVADSVRAPHLDLLVMVLPSKKDILTFVDYHRRCLVWYHGSYNAAVFQKDLDEFYSKLDGDIRHRDVNLQWVALLFAILTGSLTCSSSHTASSWGYKDAERSKLCRQWYNATVTCLNLAGYVEEHTVYSIQAISTLTISAHMLGLANSQTVLLASANRIAQSLGLHRLGEEKVSITDSNSPLRVESARRLMRETGRRVWCQLCTQDWFSIPFSESFALNPNHFDTGKPLNCNDGEFTVLSPDVPSITSYCNYLYDIACLMPQLQDAMTSAKTLYTKYEYVLEYDQKMREIATAYMPAFLSNSSPVPPNGPIYIPWARRSLTICAAHKIIMIHRKFIVLSFTNSTFDHTRRTCIAACKTILAEAQATPDKHGPVLWIDQAFVVAAGIILCLDAFHRKPDDAAYTEHKDLVQKAIGYLYTISLSMLATRGIKLLSFLRDELVSYQETNGTIEEGSKKRKRQMSISVSSFMRSMSSSTGPSAIKRVEPGAAADGNAWDAFTDFFPPQTGFGGDHLFENFFEFEA